MKATAQGILQQYWGYPDFRSVQYEVIESALAGNDTIALMPTGGGKSICFQVPALMEEGLTLVISPLIALMNDQVAQLKDRGIKAAAIHSSLHYKEIERLLDNVEFGGIKLLYISPERLVARRFWMRLAQLPLKRLVVDEAHCISLWGYDFRPAYLKIAEVRSLFPKIGILALTASATPDVLKDIAEKLELKTPKIIRGDFLRPNLKFGILSTEDKKDRIFRLLHQRKGVAIVYARNRRQCREIATFLHRKGLLASYYHAGLDRKVRAVREQAFLSGQIKVMVSTNAFGMGVDKSDVRMVLHYDLPENLESYYQEAGRAGRDGAPAYAVILYHKSDRIRLENQFERTFPSFVVIKQVYRALGNYLKLAVGSGEGVSFPFDLNALTQVYKLEVYQVYSALKILEQAGWLVLSENVYEPSKIRVVVDKEVLYDYQLRNKKKDLLIRGLLRVQQGVLLDFVPIKESQLATFLHQDLRKVRSGLRDLHTDGIVEYLEQSEKGRLTLIRERVAYDNLTIDQELLTFRKKRYRAGLDTLYRYIELDSCRQRFILNYFGVDHTADCGVCDQCRRNEQIQLHGVDVYKDLKTDILLALEEGPLRISKLIYALKTYPKEWVQQTLEYMLLEEEIEKSNDLVQKVSP